MASQDRIKAINAEARAKENLKKVEADLAKMEKANAEKRNTYSQQEISNLEEKKKKVEAYLEKVKGIKEGVDAFKDTADSISLSSRATASLSTALGTLVKNFRAISSINIKQDMTSAELDFVNKFQEGASKFLSAQQDLMNADPSDKETFAQYEKDLDIAKQFLNDLIKENETLLGQNTQLNQYVQDFAKGMGSVAEQVGITKNLSAAELEQYKELTAEADKMSTRFKAVGNQITAAFKKPNVLIGLMFLGLSKVATAVGKTTREMGGFVGGLTGTTAQVTALSVVFPQALESAKGLSSEFGGLSDTSFDTQLNTNLMAMNMGISGKEAAQLVGQFARLNDGSVGTAENLIASTKELAKQKGLIPSQVMADVAGSARAFAEYGKAGGTNIAEAAVAAGQLGTNLDGVTKVTDTLLDFQNSINTELELGARLGRNINFQEARRLAYQGDIKGALQSALQQMGGIEAFNRMDIFQKRAAAAALGLSTEEMQKMLSNMDKLNKDGSIQVSQFDQMKEVLTGLATGFGGQMLQTLGYLSMAAPLFKGIGGVVKGIGKGIWNMGAGIKDAIVSSGKFLINLVKIAAQKLGFGGGPDIAGSAKDAFTLAKEKGLSDKQILAGFGGKEAKDMMQVPESVADSAKDSIADKAKDKVSDKAEDLVDDKLDSVADKISDKAEGVAPDESIGGKLTSLASGLTAMGTGQVLKGALNLIPTALGFIAILPGIPGMFLVGKTGISAGKGLLGLAPGLMAMNGTLSGSTSLIAAGIGFSLLTLGFLGMAGVGALGAYAGQGLLGLAPGLVAMTPTLAGSTSLIAAGLGFTLMTLGLLGMTGVGALGAFAGAGLLGLAPGLLAMTPTLLGSASLIAAGLGFTLMIPGAVGMGLVGLLGAYAGAGLIGLSAGLLAMTPTLLGSASLVAAALGFTLMIPGSVGMLLLGAAAPIAAFGIFTLIPALTALGVLMTSGVGAIGIITLIGLGVGLGTTLALIGAGAMMFGKGIELAANGLNSFLPTLSTFMESINLKQVGLIGLLSLAFIGLAGSLMFLGAAGLFALPTLLGIAAASAGIAMVAEVFGFAGGESKSEETTALESESVSTFEKDVLTEIRNVATAIKQGMVVKMDGRQVSQGIERASNRSLQNNTLIG